MKNAYTIPLILSLLVNFSCTKLVEVDPPVNKTMAAGVYGSDASAISVVTYMYVELTNFWYTDPRCIGSLGLFGSLYTDELNFIRGQFTNQTLMDFYNNNLNSNFTNVSYWEAAYSNIYRCNLALDGLNASVTLSPGIKKQLLSELKFFRALNYYYLVNLYGDIPWVVSTDYTLNATLGKTPAIQVLKNIQADLRDARDQLSANWLDGTLLKPSTTDRFRVTTHAASALLTKVCLMTGDWEEAETEADKLINNSAQFSLDSLNGCFLVNSRECIWQLQVLNSNGVSQVADIFIPPSTGLTENRPFYVTPALLNKFEPGDLRKENWLGTVTMQNVVFYYPYKYKVIQPSTPAKEALCVFRLGDIYLCRAEARMRQNKPDLAVEDINAVRRRAGLQDLGSLAIPALLNALLQERSVEMFTEFGARFLDLKRLGVINSVMPSVCAAKGVKWETWKSLFPIKIQDVQRNPNMKQNEGY
ncbi:MAG: RagB/SusD family nutrient uptake outer membrane protein [Chitinophagaceae bacterium]|nr:RagB/SusD family nutrient uptake outer membrane protein [Chitinophagaceae bacterium]